VAYVIVVSGRAFCWQKVTSLNLFYFIVHIAGQNPRRTRKTPMRPLVAISTDRHAKMPRSSHRFRSNYSQPHIKDAPMDEFFLGSRRDKSQFSVSCVRSNLLSLGDESCLFTRRQILMFGQSTKERVQGAASRSRTTAKV
jgi:hypothetical protein